MPCSLSSSSYLLLPNKRDQSSMAQTHLLHAFAAQLFNRAVGKSQTMRNKLSIQCRICVCPWRNLCNSWYVRQFFHRKSLNIKQTRRCNNAKSDDDVNTMNGNVYRVVFPKGNRTVVSDLYCRHLTIWQQKFLLFTSCLVYYFAQMKFLLSNSLTEIITGRVFANDG